jgi:Fe-S oxidoreductase
LKKYPLESEDLRQFLTINPQYDEILRLLTTNADYIIQSWPRLSKNSSGYNLQQVAADLKSGIFNLPALYVGSEGTLGLFLAVKLRLLRIPEGSRSFRLFFDSLEQAGTAVELLLETGPSALEIVDGATLNLIGRQKHSIPENAQAMLLLEYDDDIDNREDGLKRRIIGLGLTSPLERADDEEERALLWAARKAVVPILYRHHETKRPFAFIEDVSLPVSKLTGFIEWIRRRFEKEGLTFGMVGHIGDGNLHIRPLLDINTKNDYELTLSLYDEVYSKVFELGGSSTAEHADGRLRAPVVRHMYGDEIYDIFKRIKSILDPENLFNPDVLLSDRQFTDDLDFKKLELTCAACGKCNGYCPASEIFHREDMSPRGWLRMMKLELDTAGSLEQFYQFCLNCKNCTTVCPAGVDIAGEILEYKAVKPHKLAGRIISIFDRQKSFAILLRFGSLLAPLVRSNVGRRIAALMGKRSFGFDEDVQLPEPVRKTLRERYPALCHQDSSVALFHGCADNFLESNAGDAVVRVFNHYGWKLAFPQQRCCGLPMEVYGHRDNLIEKAKYNIDALSGFEVVIFTCASCLHRLTDYHRLFEESSPYHIKALALKEKLFDVSQFLQGRDIDLPDGRAFGKKRISYHHPCHLRASGLEKEPLRLLGKIEGINLLHPEQAERCCGQAGSFGFTHYQEGMAIFENKKREYIDMGAEVIFSSCPSCISKIRKEMGESVSVCHPIEIFAEMIERNNQNEE